MIKESDKFIRNIVFSKRIISKDEIRKIVNFYIKEYKLHSYLQNVSFVKSEYEKCAAFYDKIEKNIVIDQDRLDSWIDVNYKNCLEKYPEIDYNQFYLYAQLSHLLHEIRHVIQNKINITYGKTKDEYLLSKIIRDCFWEKKEKYEEHYDLFPIEKDANVFAYGNCISFFMRSNTINNDFYRLLINVYWNNVKEGYSAQFEGEPLLEFYSKAKNNLRLYQSYCEQMNILSIKQKVSFNFPLSEIERVHLQDLEKKSKESISRCQKIMKKI